MTKLLDVLLRRPAAAPEAEPQSRTMAPDRIAAKIGYLAQTDIFRDLTPDDMTELERMTAMTTCRRGRVFYTPETTGEVLFILKKGRVNIYRITADGRKLITATIEPGTVFGEMSFIGQGMWGASAEAAEDCTLCVMSRADLEHLLLTHPCVALRLVEVLAERLRAAEERLETVAFKSVTARLAATLLHLAGEGGCDVTGTSHQDLAEMVGAYRETTTRLLNEFRARGLIDLHRLRIHILDPEGLRKLTED
jgi:CRP/FNR family cyclic AMP-dependent transcriptional regulator